MNQECLLLLATCLRLSDVAPYPFCNVSTFLTILTPWHPGWMVANANFNASRKIQSHLIRNNGCDNDKS